MKYYDKYGGQHDSLFHAYLADIKDVVDKLLHPKPISPAKLEPIDEADLINIDDVVVEDEKPTTVEIDYAHNQTVVKDAAGNVVASAELSDKLSSAIDEDLKAVLYKDEEIPGQIHMNLGSTHENTEASTISTEDYLNMVGHTSNDVVLDEEVDPEFTTSTGTGVG